jgi:hypothetical protein
VIVRLLADTGIRAGELISLTPMDLSEQGVATDSLKSKARELKSDLFRSRYSCSGVSSGLQKDGPAIQRVTGCSSPFSAAQGLGIHR